MTIVLRIAVLFGVCAGLLARRCAAEVPCTIPLPACPADIVPPGGDGQIDTDDLLGVIITWGLFGPPRPTADCGPLPNGDCTVNTDDLIVLISTWGPCVAPKGACMLPNHHCAFVTESKCNVSAGLAWEIGVTCTDTDGDRIPDVFELNNCSSQNGAYVGTNPGLADTDGDRLTDGDEMFGTISEIDLPGMGANPLRKNLFMEVDWTEDAVGGTTHIHRPPAAAVTALIAAFANSPVTNVCGGNGVALIIDYGQGGAFTDGNLIGADDFVIFDSEFNEYKVVNFAANRNGYFYYAIHCHRYNSATNGSSGVAELTGDDHIVSLLSSYTSVSAVSKTMMHEFGHNLGLRHGGDENLNYKPNYNSVMNYRFQFPGADGNCNSIGDGVLNYSIGANISLNENALLEVQGVCGATAIDWNGNGSIDALPIALNINCSAGNRGDCGANVSGCNDTTCGTLADFNDWAAITFNGLSHSDFVGAEIIECNNPAPNGPAGGRLPR